MSCDHKFTEGELTEDLYRRYPALLPLQGDISAAADRLTDCLRAGGRVFLCGNGGSSADCAHIAGELLKGFLSRRLPPEEIRSRFRAEGPLGELVADQLQGSLGAVDLTAQGAIIAAVANDCDPRMAYAQQLWGLGRKGDLLIGISTSGNAENVRCAALVAKALGMTTLALTGASGGAMGKEFDLAVRVPSGHTPEVQEYHLPVYHYLCAVAEARLFD